MILLPVKLCLYQEFYWHRFVSCLDDFFPCLLPKVAKLYSTVQAKNINDEKEYTGE